MTSTSTVVERYLKAAQKIDKRCARKNRIVNYFEEKAREFYQETAAKLMVLFPKEDSARTNPFAVEAKQASAARAFAGGTSATSPKGADGKEK